MPKKRVPKMCRPTIDDSWIKRYADAFLRVWDTIESDAAQLGEITPAIQRELCGDANRIRDVSKELDTVFYALTHEAQEWLLWQTFPDR